MRLQYFPFRIGLAPAKSSLFANCSLCAQQQPPPRPPVAALHTLNWKAAFGEKNRAHRERGAHKASASSSEQQQSIFHNSFPMDARISSTKRPGISDASFQITREWLLQLRQLCALKAFCLQIVLQQQQCHWDALITHHCTLRCALKRVNRGTRTYYFNYSTAICWFYCDITFQGRELLGCNYSHAPACRCWKIFSSPAQRFQIPLQSRQLLQSRSAVNYLA